MTDPRSEVEAVRERIDYRLRGQENPHPHDVEILFTAYASLEARLNEAREALAVHHKGGNTCRLRKCVALASITDPEGGPDPGPPEHEKRGLFRTTKLPPITDPEGGEA